MEYVFKLAVLAGLVYIAVITKEIRKEMALTRQQIKDAIAAGTAETKQHVTEASDRVTTTVNTLTQKIADLEAKVGETLTQEDLDEIKAAQKDVITATDLIDPNSPPPTPIEPVTP